MTPHKDYPEPKIIFKQPGAWLLLIILLAILLIHRETLPTNQPGLAMAPDRGYRAAANALVEGNCLQLKEVSPSEGRKIIEFAESTGGTDCPDDEIFARYQRVSLIGEDMRSLVDERWLTAANGTLIAINPNLRALRFANNRAGEWGGQVFYADGSSQAGDGALMWAGNGEVRSDLPGCPDMRVDGLPGTGSPRLAQYVHCGGSTFVWQGVAPIQSLSETTASARRVRDPALSSVLRKLEVPGMEGDVTSTIQRSLQALMQARLEGHLRGANIAGKAEPTIRAGLLLMDGLSGEIAAAATFPLRANDVVDPADVEYVEHNQNFEWLLVGSAAKVPFAAAIAQARPELLGNSPPCDDKTSCVNLTYCPPASAIDTCRTLATSGLGGSFVDFIKFSRNGHALWLFDSAYSADHSATAPWIENMRRYACIEPLDGARDPSCSGYLWRSDEPGNRQPARGESEPMVRLRMDQPGSDGTYAGVYLSMLGNGRAAWSSANLGQAYARIFLARAISPRLTPSGGETSQPLAITPPVWRAVRDGMAAVLTDGGTAADLCHDIGCAGNRRGNLFLYAKTGTPTINLSSDDDGRVLVLLAAQTCTGTPPSVPGDISRLKIVVITQRYEGEHRNPIDLAIRLFGEAPFVRWLSSGPARSCQG
jgi:hypothetical protein